MALPEVLPAGDRHAHLTGPKLRIVRAIHDDMGWVTTDHIAEAIDRNTGYTRRLLAELADEGIVDRAEDGSYTGRGQAPYLWSCCGS
jgi:predicted transcriptional regulator